MNAFHTEGTAEMKKFTSGANGHMFSLFRLRAEEENREESLRKERLCGLFCFVFFLHIVAPTPREFLITWLSDCRPVSSRAGRSQRER